jgi:hypothetical protein
MLLYSYLKGKELIKEVNITFNQEREIYLQGETFQLTVEVPKQLIFETREIFIEVEYTSVINEQTVKRQEKLLLQRRTDGKVFIEHELAECDLITVEIKKFWIQDLCGCFRFYKKVEFYQSILVFPPEYSMEKMEYDKEPVFYLDLGSLRNETDPIIRKNYLAVVYSISSELLLRQQEQKFLLGTEELFVCEWEDYYMLFLGIFEIIRGSMPFVEKQDKQEVTHVITTKSGIPVKNYSGNTIALVGTIDQVDPIQKDVDYVVAANLKEDLYYLSL